MVPRDRLVQHPWVPCGGTAQGDGHGSQPWAACVRRKWKTTEQSEELSIAPRRPARHSLKPCYYSSPDGNLAVHLLFSSSRPFHNKKKNEISPIFPNYLAMFPRQPPANSFAEKPRSATRQPCLVSSSARGGTQPVPGAAGGDKDGATGGDTWLSHASSVPLLCQPRFWQELHVGRGEALLEAWAGNAPLPPLSPHKCVGSGGELRTGARFPGSGSTTNDEV